MSFSTDLAKLIEDQLTRFATLNPHQLAGHVANLDFWLSQVRHALATLDGYGVRFVRMEAVQEHQTRALGPLVSTYDPVDESVYRKPPKALRVPDREIQEARRGLVEAATRFVERCRAESLLTDAVAAAAIEAFEQ